MITDRDTRLLAVASFVQERHVVYDVGSDHGYLPIYLVTVKHCPLVIAVENKIKPWTRLRRNVSPYAQIRAFLADGLAQLTDEVQTVTIAGMGGRSIVKIIGDHLSLKKNLTQDFVLEPQSQAALVRKYLNSIGYAVKDECYVKEHFKYYPVLHYVRGRETIDEVEAHFGKVALSNGDPVLKEMLEKKIETLKGLRGNNGQIKIALYEEGLRRWKSEN